MDNKLELLKRLDSFIQHKNLTWNHEDWISLFTDIKKDGYTYTEEDLGRILETERDFIAQKSSGIKTLSDKELSDHVWFFLNSNNGTYSEDEWQVFLNTLSIKGYYNKNLLDAILERHMRYFEKAGKTSPHVVKKHAPHAMTPVSEKQPDSIKHGDNINEIINPDDKKNETLLIEDAKPEKLLLLPPQKISKRYIASVAEPEKISSQVQIAEEIGENKQDATLFAARTDEISTKDKDIKDSLEKLMQEKKELQQKLEELRLKEEELNQREKKDIEVEQKLLALKENLSEKVGSYQNEQEKFYSERERIEDIDAKMHAREVLVKRRILLLLKAKREYQQDHEELNKQVLRLKSVKRSLDEREHLIETKEAEISLKLLAVSRQELLLQETIDRIMRNEKKPEDSKK